MPVAAVQAAGPIDLLDDVVSPPPAPNVASGTCPPPSASIDRKEIGPRRPSPWTSCCRARPASTRRGWTSPPEPDRQTYVRGLPRQRALADAGGWRSDERARQPGGLVWLSTLDVGRVEGGAWCQFGLYGNSAMGGVVNVISRNLEPGTHGRARPLAARYRHKRVAGSIDQQSGDSGVLRCRPATSTAAATTCGARHQRRAAAGVPSGPSGSEGNCRPLPEIDGSEPRTSASYRDHKTPGCTTSPATHSPGPARAVPGFRSIPPLRRTVRPPSCSPQPLRVAGGRPAPTPSKRHQPDVSSAGHARDVAHLYRGDFFDRSVGLNVRAATRAQRRPAHRRRRSEYVDT